MNLDDEYHVGYYYDLRIRRHLRFPVSTRGVVYASPAPPRLDLLYLDEVRKIARRGLRLFGRGFSIEDSRSIG
jgi:hypothetical protein